MSVYYKSLLDWADLITIAVGMDPEHNTHPVAVQIQSLVKQTLASKVPAEQKTLMERAVCLLSTRRKELPFQNNSKEMHEVIEQVAKDVLLRPARWSSQAHANAIEAVFLDFMLERLMGQKYTSNEQANRILDLVLGFLFPQSHTDLLTQKVIAVGLGLLYIIRKGINRESAGTFLRHVSYFLQRSSVIDDKNATHAEVAENIKVIAASVKLLKLDLWEDLELRYVLNKHYFQVWTKPKIRGPSKHAGSSSGWSTTPQQGSCQYSSDESEIEVIQID